MQNHFGAINQFQLSNKYWFNNKSFDYSISSANNLRITFGQLNLTSQFELKFKTRIVNAICEMLICRSSEKMLHHCAVPLRYITLNLISFQLNCGSIDSFKFNRFDLFFLDILIHL